MILNGKVALVTGAGSGIGKATALRLAKEGANVVAADVRMDAARATADEVVALGRSALAVQVDVTNLSELKAMVELTVQAYDRLDILVTCAGIVQHVKMMHVEEATWDRILAVNAKGSFFTIQAVAAQMMQQKSGSIVTLSSVSARGPRPRNVHYAASKAAVVSITLSWAAELAPYGITVNTLMPGIIATPMWDQIDQDMLGEWGIPIGEHRQKRAQLIPLGRLGTPEDVAGAVAFLASPDASYITGQALGVNGGMLMA